jgi:hypothetical protein
MIEVASEINSEMPAFVVRRSRTRSTSEVRSVSGSRILVLGVSYKKDIDDLRESPAITIIEQLQARGAQVVYHDPHCPEIRDDGHTAIRGLPMQSVELTDDEVRRSDAVVVITDHSTIDYQRVADLAEVIVDTRGVMRGIDGNGKIESLSPLSRVRRVVRKVKKTLVVAGARPNFMKVAPILRALEAAGHPGRCWSTPGSTTTRRCRTPSSRTWGCRAPDHHLEVGSPAATPYRRRA